MLIVSSCQWCAILLVGHQQYDLDDTNGSSYFDLSKMISQPLSRDVPSSSKLGKTFPYYFVQKYIVQNCKYKGGGLRKTKQGMFDFFINPKTQLTKIGSGSNGKVKQKWGPIKFIKECNMVELLDDIDEDIWIDNTLPLAFDYFNIYDDPLEYLGAHS